MESYFRANRTALERIAFYTTRDRDDAEEAVQESYLLLQTHAADYKSGTDFPAWVRSYVWRVSSSIYRNRVSATQKLPFYLEALNDERDLADNVNTNVTMAGDDLEAIWHYVEYHADALIFDALLTLPCLERALLTRAYIKEEDQGDIAADWGISPSALRNRLVTAKRRLRQVYNALNTAN